MLRLPLPCFLVVYYYLSLIAMAAEVNITVDDTHSSISYHPLRSWSARISHCHTTGGAYNRTWHEPAYGDAGSVGGLISISVNFIGIALYLYSPPGCSPSPSGLTYNLDGRAVSSMSTYSPVFAYWNLPNTQHNLIVEVDPASTFPFDYLIYTTATEPIPSLLVQARQVAGDNSTISLDPSSISSSSSSSNDTNSSKTQVGAIAYAVAASVGITALFSIGLAISIMKIRRQRHRVHRERREHDQNRRRLAIHLPPASVSASRPPRYSEDITASVEPPSYDAVMRPSGRTSITPGQGPYVMHSHLATISEVATVLSMSQPSISTRRDIMREDSLEGMPPSPPGLGTMNQSSISQHPRVHSDRDA